MTLKRIDDMTPEEANEYFVETYVKPAVEYAWNQSLLRILKDSGVDPREYAVTPTDDGASA